MAKLKSISTSIWSDNWFEDLNPTEKLLFIYLLTNEKNNMLGVYEISIKKISFETGINKETIQKALKEFERIKKVKYCKGFIMLVNYLKHQNFNSNMKKSAIDVFNELPNELKPSELTNHLQRDNKGFETLCESFGMLRKIEVEIEEEIEEESKDIIEFDLFWNLYDKKVGDKKKLLKKWNNLLDDERKLALEHIPKYKASQPDKIYRKNPETYLNNKSWNDEIIKSNAINNNIGPNGKPMMI